jgi:GAF domain-containing protein
VLKQVRARREREDLSRQLNQTNQELQRRVRELTTIFALGKAVTSITDQQNLFEKAVEGAVYVAEADCGWLLLREERGKAFILSAQRNLPPEAAGQMHRAWDDGLSSLVGLSGEPLLISGEPLKKFRVSRFGKAALVVPVKARKEVIGLLVVVRKALQPFTPAHQRLLEAVADFASISLVNARLFKALEERAYASSQAAEKAQASAHSKDQLLQNTLRELRDPLSDALETIVSLLVGDGDRLNATQKALLRSAQDRLAKAAQSLQTISPSKP